MNQPVPSACKWLCLRCGVKGKERTHGTLGLQETRGAWLGEWQAVCEHLSLSVCDQMPREESDPQ